jgi:large subunit ribosomal protein L9
MDVILLERVEKLGAIGDVVTVKDGFARNFLLPRKKALRATEANKARFEQQRAQIETTNLKRREEAQGISGKVDGMTIVLVRQAGETGQLFGSVTPRDIADAIAAEGVTVDRRQVILDRPIKMLGLHPLRIALHPEVIVSITANVARSAEEAAIQLKHGGFVGTAEERQATLDEMLAEADTQLPPEVLAQRQAEAEAAKAAEAAAEAVAAPAEPAAKPRKKKKEKAADEAKD